MSAEKLDRFHYCQISKFWLSKSALLLSDRFWTDLKICLQVFILAKSLQKTCLYIHEKLQRNPSIGRGLKIFVFDKRPKGCDEVKNSMGLLQGPRLMAWTTKSPIRQNHWVPLGCTVVGLSARPCPFNYFQISSIQEFLVSKQDIVYD